MRVRQAELFKVALPLKREFETSSHRKRSVTHIVLRLETVEGLLGFGEVACEAAPFYGPETVGTCWEVLRGVLVPTMLELDWDDPVEIAAALARFRGNHFAKAGLDIACWDIFARSRGVSLAAALGGSRSEIESGVSLGIIASLDALADEARRIERLDYKRLKLKIRPGMADEAVRTVRDAARSLPLMVDANGSFADDHDAELARLDRYALLMIEQPFGPASLLAHQKLKSRLATPICLDESIPSVDHVRLALDLDCCSIVNAKVSRLGGLTYARAVHDLCVERGIPVWCGGMHEFGIGRAANIAISALPGFALPGDVSSSDERYDRDIVWPPIAAKNGVIRVPTAPGLGYEVDAELIRSLATETVSFTASSRVLAAT